MTLSDIEKAITFISNFLGVCFGAEAFINIMTNMFKSLRKV